MWKLAGSDDDLKRYVLGYVSHIGTDVVGHPFVNAVTGGPYRMHWKRTSSSRTGSTGTRGRPIRTARRRCVPQPLAAEDTYLQPRLGSYYYR